VDRWTDTRFWPKFLYTILMYALNMCLYCTLALYRPLITEPGIFSSIFSIDRKTSCEFEAEILELITYTLSSPPANFVHIWTVPAAFVSKPIVLSILVAHKFASVQSVPRPILSCLLCNSPSICDLSICDLSICDLSICDLSICDLSICGLSQVVQFVLVWAHWWNCMS
jgi:hypothetical protein